MNDCLINSTECDVIGCHRIAEYVLPNGRSIGSNSLGKRLCEMHDRNFSRTLPIDEHEHTV